MKQSDPEEIYGKLRKKEKGKLDKGVLDQFPGAVLGIPWWECKNPIK